MVVLIDFESEDDDPYCQSLPHQTHNSAHHGRRMSLAQIVEGLKEQKIAVRNEHDTHSNGRLFASALACYPVSLSIAAELDLNDLYSLSFSCRNVHESLSQFAHQLRTQSLHCTNDVPARSSEEEADAIIFQEAMGAMAEPNVWDVGSPGFPLSFDISASHLHTGMNSALGLSGKISQCARDMVAPCRRCGTVVCRNCAAKPPSDRCLPNRHRRLCRTCLDASLVSHLQPLDNSQELHDTPPASSASSARSVRSSSSSSSHGDVNIEGYAYNTCFTSPTFLRHPCDCATRGVFLCQPCGQGLNSADTTYKRVWTWRSRYSTHIGGGLGTGLGLGNQGQKCGRGEHCLENGAAGVCWVEIECSEARAQKHGLDSGLNIGRSTTPLLGDHDGRDTLDNRPGYLSQELEGIGGVLKKKVKKRVKVGATVYEFDDERETGKYLRRESSGTLRSWCGWCSRVCPGEMDKAKVDRLLNIGIKHI